MQSDHPTKGKVGLDLILYSILFLFALQLLTAFMESIYAFGLLGTSIPVEIAAVVLFFSPILLVAARKGVPDWVILALGELVLVARALEMMLATRPRILVSGIGVGAFLVYLPALLWDAGKKEHKREKSAVLAASLLLASVTLVFLKAVNSGVDYSTVLSNFWLGWVLASAAGAMLARNYRSRQVKGGEDQQRENFQAAEPASFGRIAGLCVGVCAVFLLLYFAFASPNVIVRWSAADYSGVMSYVFLSFTLFILLMTLKGFRALLKPLSIWIGNTIFVLSMALTILAHQVQFPMQAGLYPLYEPGTSAYAYIPLAVMVLLSPVLVIDFYLYTGEIIRSKTSLPRLAGGFTLGALFMLVMVFAHIFTTVYDYIPLVGPLLRDKFWLVHLVAGAVLVIGLLFVRDTSFDFSAILWGRKTRLVYLVYTLAAGLISIYSIWTISNRLPISSSADGALKVLSYNIQQGYSEGGIKNYDGQLEHMRSLNADIIGLQESDTNRIYGGNTDLVRYFADNLNMYSYYGPKTVNGTFGVALLSKLPLENPRTFYMYSEGEQTAAIHAQVSTGGEIFNIMVTHLGNDGPAVQQEAVLKETQDKNRLILMGDFNFEPDTAQYRMTVETLVDAWLARWPSGEDDRGVNPVERIDHIFLTPDLHVETASYLENPASDHPAVLVSVSR